MDKFFFLSHQYNAKYQGLFTSSKQLFCTYKMKTLKKVIFFHCYNKKNSYKFVRNKLKIFSFLNELVKTKSKHLFFNIQ